MVVVVVLCFAFMAYIVATNWQQLEPYGEHLRLHYHLLLVAFMLYPTGLVPNTVAWHYIMVHLGGAAKFKTNARIYCYSCLPRRIPGGVWHIAGRAILNKEQGVGHAKTLLGTSLEWLLLVVSGMLVYLASHLSPAGRALESVGLDPAAALALTVPLLVLLLPPVLNRIVRIVVRSGDEQLVALKASHVLKLVAIFVVAWCMGGLILYLVLLAFSPLPLSSLPVVVGAWGGAGAAGLVAAYILQGLGVHEATLALLLTSVVPLPMAIVASILMRILLTAGDVLWPLFWLRFLREEPAPVE
jgi:glycosyltransferase 2 family protein